jgi:tetratricopeptide (TPR) repeat protein
MKMKNLLNIYIFLAIIGSGSLMAQTQKAWEAAAVKAMDFKDYYAALIYYQNLLEFDKENTDVIYKCAESARLFNSYKLAAGYYKQVVDKEKNGKYPLASFYLAEMNMYLGKYKEAQKQFELFLSENADEGDDFTDIANLRLRSIEFAMVEKDIPFEDLDLEHLGGQINTPYTEFGPYLKGDSLYYSSLRFENKKDTYKPQRPVSKVLVSKNEGAGLPLEDGFNMDALHTSHTSFSPDKSIVYYTICEYLNGKDIRCDLYSRTVNEDGSFGEAARLPDNVNNAAFSSTQPAAAKDLISGKDILYFVSNREGGKGGLDIYYVEVLGGGNYSDPVNFDIVNTAQDDVTPFYHNPTGVFYWASNGLPGMGGYDIYRTEIRDGNWLEAENLSIPVNSSFNDLYYMITDDNDVAYFASNRLGGFFLDESTEACCNDIYKATYLEIDINLIARTFDKLTNEPVAGASVTLIDESGVDDPIGITNLDANEFKYKLSRAKDYVVLAEKDGFFPDTVKVSTKRVRTSQTIEKNLYLRTRNLDLQVFTFDKRNNQALNGSTIKLIDKDNPDDELIVQMDDETNEVVFPIDRDKEFYVIATKRGYSPDTASISTMNSDQLNLITANLYLGLGNLEDFLPLTLYFDNDEPEKRTYKTKTNLRYDETFPPYFSRKQEFINAWSTPLTGEEKARSEAEVRNFFDKEVKQGNEFLGVFVALLEKAIIEENQKVEIVLQGFASPRASAAYNDALSKRRISSVMNQITRYSDGKLVPYMQNKRLVISERAYGSRRAPKYVSGSIKDERNSIYSIPASRERRVEIIQVTRNKSNRR